MAGKLTETGKKVLKMQLRHGRSIYQAEQFVEQGHRMELFREENSFECQGRLGREAVRIGIPVPAQPLLAACADASPRAREFVGQRNAQIGAWNAEFAGKVVDFDPTSLEFTRKWAETWKANRR